MAINYTWPAPGAVGWGDYVDLNLESIESRLNTIEGTLATVGSNTGSGAPGPAGPAGPAGAPGPMSIRFCIAGVWQARPSGTATLPIINVSIGQATAPTPPNPVEGDVWFY